MFRSSSYMAIPPGETINEQLEDRNLTQKDLARLTGLSEKHISRLVNGLVILTPETAARLEQAIEVPARYWLALEAGYRADLLKVQEENAAATQQKDGLSMQEWITQELTPRLLTDPKCAQRVLRACRCHRDRQGRIHPVEA